MGEVSLLDKWKCKTQTKERNEVEEEKARLRTSSLCSAYLHACANALYC